MWTRKLIVFGVLCAAGYLMMRDQLPATAARSVELSLHEFREPGEMVAARREWQWLALQPVMVTIGVIALGVWLFAPEAIWMLMQWSPQTKRTALMLTGATIALSSTG